MKEDLSKAVSGFHLKKERADWGTRGRWHEVWILEGSLFLPCPSSHRVRRKKEKRKKKRGSQRPVIPMLTLAKRRRRN